ncbi:MAG TPA: DNA-binding protein [Frateuria sp.]|uniref:DNA-binding protein n=1 Tax=Frateuria sp. TaxID=2211372 RepID=UPI002DF42729|nr:DNA-binding protein [Frateuria sp.]
MPRGITQDQVNAAADAILGAGENPTVEKVRAELGTGSPNTVTRMLDAWRGQLGERLRQLSALPELPTPVGQAMMGLWQLATEQASQAIAGRFAEERAALEAARGALATERQAWTARLEAAETDRARTQAAKDLAEHACATLDAQLQDSHALRADLAQQRDRLHTLCDHQAHDLKVLRSQLAELQSTFASERTRQEAYIRGLEDRAHQEIDRARQETKHWQQLSETTDRAHQDAITKLLAQRDGLFERLRMAEKELAVSAGQVAGLEKALSKTRLAKPSKSKTGRAKKAAAGVRGRSGTR